ncbi:MAG: pyridoxal-phosphate dependent enzyme [Phototrophicales bacterium]|nr:pyridoxal-phosphate dependent enzyme [Phototrophicales bacterium]
MTNYFTKVVCLECGHEMPADMTLTTCEKCQSGWLDARYDYDAVKPQWENGMSGVRSLWRYGALLPITVANPEISLGEGYTPLVRLYQYERIYGHEGIYIKDERHQPTNSFKDRQASLSVTAMHQQGITECVLASTGNAAVAYAAYCARANIKLWLFLTSLVPNEKMREAALYGAEVVKVSGTYDETKKIAAQFAERKGVVMDKGARTVPSKESMKTLGYEIAEQLALERHPDGTTKWLAPDWYIQAVSGGIGPIGVWKGFQELFDMGLIDKMPKLGIIQAAGCAPMVIAFHNNEPKATAVVPKTLIHVLATGDPGHAYNLLYTAAKSNGGTMLSVEDGDTFQAMRHLASRAGISVEPATAVAFAGLDKMFAQGLIAKGETIVINCSGHTMSAESHILGDQYDRYVLDLTIDPTDHTNSPKQDGLGAALQNLDEQVTTVVIVDDNPNDRRLIRRLLQSYKNYRVYEAPDGAEGLKVIIDRKPDLVVCDLTMPVMDGLTLLERLKKNPITANIPVVVVSAKNLSEQDRKTLDDYSDSVWTKGGFETRQLVDHVVNVLGHTPVTNTIQPSKTPETQTADTTTKKQGQHTIVIIEDNPLDLRLAKRMLATAKDAYYVIEAATGRAGLKAIYTYHPDLIILDLMLPDLDGFAILETLKNDVNLRDIPVMVVSAKSLDAEEQKRLNVHIKVLLEKASLDRKQLLDLIKNELSE